jgi:hypothetical protein
MKNTIAGLKLTVTFPDGTKETRTTKRDYTHVCALQITDDRGVNPWFACWSSTRKGAEAAAQKWQNCPEVKKGRMTVKTEIIQVWK